MFFCIVLSLVSIFYFSIHVIFSYSAFTLQECSIKSVSQSVSHSGTFCHQWTGTTIKLCTKFEISKLTHHEDMKGDKECKDGVVWG